MHTIFISYRRSESAGYTGWLHEHLIGYFGDANVYLDIASTEAGADYVNKINTTIAACDVVLVVIGNAWLKAHFTNSERRRLDDPEDRVRLEIEEALAQGRKVIPVLVDGATMPLAADLPASLHAFARCQAQQMHNRNFRKDAEELARAIHGGFVESRLGKSTLGSTLIESGLEIKNSRFRFKAFFAEGEEFILTGTNFGDQMGDFNVPPSMLHQLIVSTLKRAPGISVYIVIAPFELLEMMVPNSRADLESRSASRLLMLANDPRLTSDERARLHIFDHRGATFLSIALRDPNGVDRAGIVVASPRWFSDEAGPQRMFFAIEERLAPQVFQKFIEPIYPRIKIEEKRLARQPDRTLGGRTIEQICTALGAVEDPFTVKLKDWPLH